MTTPAQTKPLTRREELRLRRALDARLVDAIFGTTPDDDARRALGFVPWFARGSAGLGGGATPATVTPAT